MRIIYTLLYFLIGALFFHPAQSQDQMVSLGGQVLDAVERKPLQGAYVQVVGQPGKGTVTDRNGEFTLTGLPPMVEVEISFVGFSTQRLKMQPGLQNLIILEEAGKSLEEVQVIGEKLQDDGTRSLSSAIIDRGLIERNLGASLGSVLANIDGVNFVSMGSNIQLPVIHGLYGNRILVLNNGFKHGFQNWGNDHAPEIDVSGADNITVVKGAAGVRYGPEALGGAIVVEGGRLPFNSALKGSISTGVQTNGRGANTQFHLGQGWKNFSYHLGGSASIVGDRRAPDYLLTNTGAREYAFNAGARYRIGAFNFKAYYSFVDQNLAILRSSVGSSGPALIRNFEAKQPTFIRPFSYEINEPNQLAQHHLASITTDWAVTDKSLLTLRYAYQFNQRQEFDVRRNAQLPIFDLDLSSHDVQLEFKHGLLPNSEGSVGVQLFSQNNINNPGTNITPFIPNYRTTRLSAFAVENLSWGSHTVELGLRYDFENNSVSGRDRTRDVFDDSFNFSNFTATAGYIAQLSPVATYRTNIGLGWRPPNMAELYSFGQHEARTMFGLLRYEPVEGGTITADRVIPLSESGVLPEQSYKFVNEVEVLKDQSRLNLTVYANYISNFIFNRPIGVLSTARGPMPTFIFDQADAVFVGTDLTYKREFTARLKGTAGASLIWSHNVQRNEPLINQPPINVRYQLEWSTTTLSFLDALTFSLEPSYTFRQFQAPRFISARELVEGTTSIAVDAEIFDFQEAPPGYFLLHSYLKADKGKFGASVRITNMLNTRYRDYLNLMRYFADDLGINAMFALHFNF
jgi:iron complex outermembrane receptor protein